MEPEISPDSQDSARPPSLADGLFPGPPPAASADVPGPLSPGPLAPGPLAPSGIAATAEALSHQIALRIALNHLLQQAALRIQTSLDPLIVQRTTVQEVRQLLQTDRVCLYQIDPEGRYSLPAEALAGPWPSVLDNPPPSDRLDAADLAPYRQGQARTLYLDDLKALAAEELGTGTGAELEAKANPKANAQASTKAITSPCRDWLQRLQVKSALLVPILIGNRRNAEASEQLWGLIVAHQCRDLRFWQADEIEQMQQLAVYIALALDQAQQHHNLQTQLQQLSSASGLSSLSASSLSASSLSASGLSASGLSASSLSASGLTSSSLSTSDLSASDLSASDLSTRTSDSATAHPPTKPVALPVSFP